MSPPIDDNQPVHAAEAVADLAEDRTAGFGRQFVASAKKNFQQKMNAPISCFCEIFLPILFVFGMVGIWGAVGSDTFPGRNFFRNYTADQTNDLHTALQFTTCSMNVPPLPGVNPCPPNGTNISLGPLGEITFNVDTMCPNTTATKIPVDSFCSLLPAFAYVQMLEDTTTPKAIPTVDDYVKMDWLWKGTGIIEPQEQSGNNWFTVYKALWLDGQIRFAPNTPATHSLIAYLNATNPLFGRYAFGGVYETTAAAEAFVKTREAEVNGTWAVVEVNSLTPDNFDVTIRMNATSIMYTSMVLLDVFSGGRGDLAAYQDSYWYTGFLALQKAAYDHWLINVKGQQPPTRPVLLPMPYVKYTQWAFLQVGAANGFFALFMVLSFLYPVSQLVKSIVKEKEMRIREAMLIMGLGTGSFYTSWFVTYVLQFALSSFISTIIMKITFFKNSNFGAIFFLMWIFSWSSVALAGLLSTIFSKARISAIVSPIVYFILSMPLFLVDNIGLGGRSILLLLSPCALAEGFNRIASHEIGGGMTSKGMVTSKDDINLMTIIIMMIIDTIIYSLLALYLDAVFPSEWGTREGWCFCFTKPIAWLANRGQDLRNPEDGKDPLGFYESDEGNKNPVVVEVAGLFKEFTRGTDTFTAVNNLHFKMREGEVTVLLGHNGAGKTTAINLMTGMMEPDKGDCIVYGKSARTQMKEVRRDIALCPQHNILWDELTCYQHLDFYAALKGLKGEERHKAVMEMIAAVDLQDKVETPSGNLSGGQKRKLSVGIAFIGGSRLVILDEPTAGMDVAARRFTWDLIRRMSVGRAVLLTTHYMDEADLLGQSINIMAKGRLKCTGSGMYLKSNYSVGYTLTMSVDPNRDLHPLKRHIHDTIRHASHQPTGAEELAYRLPMNSAERFADLFAPLEQNPSDYGVRGFGITVTTLEEVFLKIAHEEESGEMGSALGSAGRGTGSGTAGASAGYSAGLKDEHSKFNDRTPAPTVAPGEQPKWTRRASAEERTFLRQFHALCVKRFHNIKRDRRTQCIQILLPVCCILLSMLLLLIEIVPFQPALEVNATSLYAKKRIDVLDTPISNCHFGHRYPVYDFSRNTTGANVATAPAFSQHLMDTFHMHEGVDRFIGMHCNDSNTGDSYLFVNYSAVHPYPEALQLYYKMSADNAAGGDVGRVKMTQFPMPWTDRQQALFSSIRSFMVGIVILIPFTFVPSTFVSWVVKEKEVKAKHLQLVSGMNYYTYWLSNFVFDILSFLVTELLVIIIFFIFNRDEYIGDGKTFGATFLLLFFYGLSGVTTAYFLAFFFDEHTTAQNIVMMANFICGFLLVFLVFMLGFFESTKDAAKVLDYIFKIVPAFCLGNGLLNLSSLTFARTFGFDANPFDMKTTGWNIVYMAIVFPVFFAITLLLDHPSRKQKTELLSHRPDEIPPAIEGEDTDVADERTRVESGLTTEDDIIVVRNFRKVYPTPVGEKVAVKNLSFGVKRGEVFGFLGTNGAGKTTTISILCGEQLPTNGRGFVAGHDVVTEGGAAQQHIGYCPQFDALLELLTCEEHLYLYGGLRGVPRDMIADVVDELLHVTGLEEYREAQAGQMSGGNKRKLSVAIALVGGPSTVFLDEPSAGMDPVARRGLWEVIDDIAKHSSVVLTTHHLEEVEALAHRVAIMVDGAMMCIGDKTHLKNKYGTGFEMNVRVKSMDWCEHFKAFVASAFPDAELREHRSTKFTYALPSTMPLSMVFKTLEQHKATVGVEDYAVAQTSIESVFLRISEAAEEADH